MCIVLFHWGQVTHVCVGKLITIGSENGQAIIRTNAELLLIRTLGAHFNETLSKIHTFSFKEMNLLMSPVKWRQVCLSLNMLKRVSGYEQSRHTSGT